MPRRTAKLTSLSAMEMNDKDEDETTSVFEWITWDLPGVDIHTHAVSKIGKRLRP